MTRWLPWALLALAAVAEARVGGGGSFSTGSHSSSGSRSGGGGGDGELVYLLIRLCVEVPEVGIPLVLAILAFIAWSAYNDQRGDDRVVVHHQRASTHDASGFHRAWAELLVQDPAASRPVLLDFLQLVYRRAWAVAGTADAPALHPFASPEVLSALASAGERPIDEVCLANVLPTALRAAGPHHELDVRFVASRLEGGQRVYVEEAWTFRRARGAVSLAPDVTTRLGCPSCGAAVQVDPVGRCTHCGTPITAGQLQWQAVRASVLVRRPLGRPELSLSRGGAEPSVAMMTVRDPDLARQLRAFKARHPDFDPATFEARLRHVFVSLQLAWGNNRWDDARPFCTDQAWNTLRFWIIRYQAAGLANRAADPSVDRFEIVRVEQDAWYEAVTVRVWATMRDWTEDTRTGKVVGGNAMHPHSFSEYWTLLRTVRSGATSGDPTRCPSCGAPLDNVNAAGVCGYCDTVITTGGFDWVLTRIDQAEVYQG